MRAWVEQMAAWLGGGLNLGCPYFRNCRSAFLDFPEVYPELHLRQYLALHGNEGEGSTRPWSWSVRWLRM